MYYFCRQTDILSRRHILPRRTENYYFTYHMILNDKCRLPPLVQTVILIQCPSITHRKRRLTGYLIIQQDKIHLKMLQNGSPARFSSDILKLFADDWLCSFQINALRVAMALCVGTVRTEMSSLVHSPQPQTRRYPFCMSVYLCISWCSYT